MGDTSSGQLALVAEVTPGVTPVTPAFAILDFVSEDLEMAANQIRSAVVTPGRVVKKSRRTGSEVGGTVTLELYRAGEVNIIMAAMLGNAFSGTPAVSKLGGSTLTPFTIERKLAANDYRRFTGCRVDSLALTLTPDAYVQAVFGFVGFSMVTANAAIAGSTYAQPGGTEKLTALDVTTIAVSNGITGAFDYASINLQISNGLQSRKRLGGSPVRAVAAGQATVTGTIDIYCEDKTFADAFVNETSFDMDIPVINAAEGYTFELRGTKITSYSDSNPGNGESFIARVGFECTLSSAYASSFGIKSH